MEDQNILDLYFHRSEQAITETDRKYGGYCYTIAYNILGNREDSEESVSDTYMAAWNTIPPKRPDILSAFLAKLTRHISIDHWRKSSAKKRGGGEIVLALEELDNCIGAGGTEEALEQKELVQILNRFLQSLPDVERNVFLSRYWYLDPIDTIAAHTGFSRSKVASMLLRIRGRLRKVLTQEGYL